jgi:F0F1-type ATP synthase assembly protein I
MPTPNGDRRPPLAVAMEKYSQVISIALTMALPPGAGYWVDSKLGTSPWFVILGAVFGMTAGMLQLFRGAGRGKRTDNKDGGSEESRH